MSEGLHTNSQTSLMRTESVLTKGRNFKRLSYRLKRVMRKQPAEQATKKQATLEDIHSKLKDYEKTQGPADFTGPRYIVNEHQ